MVQGFGQKTLWSYQKGHIHCINKSKYNTKKYIIYYLHRELGRGVSVNMYKLPKNVIFKEKENYIKFFDNDKKTGLCYDSNF